jgi:uncharacterized membrane protein (UPF0127 family)
VTYIARVAGRANLLAEHLRPAHTHWTRLRGLIGTRELPPGRGLWLKPCRQVHMFWMRYAIDVLFLDDDHHVLSVVEDLRPWRVSPKIDAATSVVELPAGTARAVGLRAGDTLEIEPQPA